MDVFVISFYGKRFLTLHSELLEPVSERPTGWRRYVWTKDLARAEKWLTEDAATDFGLRNLLGPPSRSRNCASAVSLLPLDIS